MFSIVYLIDVSQIPIVWDVYVDEALENYEKETEQWPETIAKYKKTLEEWEQNDNMELDVNERKRRKKEKPKEPKAPIPRMQFTEDTNFL